MASLFDQYDQANNSAGRGTEVLSSSGPIASGFIRSKLELQTPIFSKQRINFKPKEAITHMIVSNNQLVLTMANKMVQRIDLVHPNDNEEIDLTRFLTDKGVQSTNKVHKIFLDYTGNHLLIGITNSTGDVPVDILYLNRKSAKPRSVTKLKGHIITAVAWNQANTKDSSTGFILIGTNRGLIAETELLEEDKGLFYSSIYFKILFDIGKDTKRPAIHGLEFYSVPGADTKYFVIATTSNRLYQFVGYSATTAEPPVLMHVFLPYQNTIPQFRELPDTLNYSQLQMYYPQAGQFPKSFAWMTGAGVFYGKVDCAENKSSQDPIITDTKLFSHLQSSFEEDQGAFAYKKSKTHPSAMVLTEFHVLTAFQDRLSAMCILNEQKILEDRFNETYGELIGITKDYVKGTLWAFCKYGVFKYKIVREFRNVWEIYLEQKNYELAKEYCKDDVIKMDQVLTKQAADYYDIKNYLESARLYAHTHASFEDVALQFLQNEQTEALKTFLTEKINNLKPNESAQLTMVVMWLTELYQNELGSLRDSATTQAERRAIRAKFHNFLAIPKVKDCANKNRDAMYDMISSHGDQESLMFFTSLMKDYEKAIFYYIQHGRFADVLSVLVKQSDPGYWYQISPLLMQTIPKQTVDAWIAEGKRLEPSKLIPALIHYDHDRMLGFDGKQTQINEVSRYLEHCVYSLENKDISIHNYLLLLYAKLMPDKLMNYLTYQGQEEDSISYDLKYALRVCSDLGHKKACIHLYTIMGLYEEVVELSLLVNIDLAKKNADAIEDNDELKKKVWLKIAEHVVKEQNDVEKAMEILKDTELLKIEDILPFFPDFVTIDHFKDAILKSLKEYNLHIEGLKEEMEEAIESAQGIRTEMQKLRNIFGVVRSTDTCALCQYPVLTRVFYVFPCTHKFHSDCLTAEVLLYATNAKRSRIEELQVRMSTAVNRDDNISVGSISAAAASLSSIKEQLRSEFDELVAAECIFCGEIMISCVDLPFINSSEHSDVMDSWK